MLKPYDGAGHSFMSHTSETTYVAEAAQAAWADALAWSDKYLKRQATRGRLPTDQPTELTARSPCVFSVLSPRV